MDKEEFYELQLSEGLGKALTMDETQCLIHHLELCNKKHLNLLYVTKSWIDFFKHLIHTIRWEKGLISQLFNPS